MARDVRLYPMHLFGSLRLWPYRAYRPQLDFSPYPALVLRNYAMYPVEAHDEHDWTTEGQSDISHMSLVGIGGSGLVHHVFPLNIKC